jgi:hypothetical protein
MHPFGVSQQLITSPDYSSTTVLPIQVKDVTTASVKIEGLNIATTSDAARNMNSQPASGPTYAVIRFRNRFQRLNRIFGSGSVPSVPTQRTGLIHAGKSGATTCYRTEIG